MSPVTLKWDTAQVKDAKLSVELDGELSSDWKHGFKTTIRLLSRGTWGEVSLRKQVLRVKEVVPGSEEKLRHFLESAVAQANASAEPDEAPADEADEDKEKPDRDEADSPDGQMTRSFRGFAGSADD
jgi:hypothetical protein